MHFEVRLPVYEFILYHLTLKVIYPLCAPVCQFIYKLKSIMLLHGVVERVIVGNQYKNALQ